MNTGGNTSAQFDKSKEPSKFSNPETSTKNKEENSNLLFKDIGDQKIVEEPEDISQLNNE